MSRYTDRDYLRSDQYADGSNLSARISLHKRFSVAERGWFDWVFDRFDLPDDARVLEIGCGPGHLWAEVCERIPTGWDVTLADLSPGMVAEAESNLADCAHEFSFEVADAQVLPFDDGRFDAVVANHMLYHVPDREAAYAEFRRVLRPGGRLYATTIGAEHMRDMRELMARFADEDVSPRIDRGFELENGADQLAEWFVDVTCHRYDDALVVTEATPLVAYAASSPRMDMDEAALRALGEHVEARLESDGEIHIGKEQGLFEATRP